MQRTLAMQRTITILCSAAALLTSLSARAAAPDFDAARREAVAILRDLVRIDTTSPPGNETRIAHYLQERLDAEGIASEIYGAAPERGNLVARLEGDGSKAPVLIMGHTDVVGVQAEQWSVDPFAAEIRDGFIYGRGTVDDKDTVTAGLMTLLLLKRLDVPLARDVIYLAAASEEGGANEFGIGYMLREHRDAIDAEFALSEGGKMPVRDGHVRYVGIATTEKRIMRFRLKARGTSGHGSIPLDDNAIVHLAEAVAKLGRHRPPIQLTETTRTYFERLAHISPPDEARVFRRVLDPETRAEVIPALRGIDPLYDSMLRSSISPTKLDAGFRYNVIPGEAEATVDVRLMQDDDLERFTETVRELIDDPQVEVISRDGGRPRGPPSPLDSDLFRAIEQAQAEMFPDAVTLPLMLTGATDMAQLRAAGIAAYGIGSPTPEGENRAHANDERVGVEAFGDFIELVFRAVRQAASAE